jgi:hypothetical protein
LHVFNIEPSKDIIVACAILVGIIILQDDLEVPCLELWASETFDCMMGFSIAKMKCN